MRPHAVLLLHLTLPSVRSARSNALSWLSVSTLEENQRTSLIPPADFTFICTKPQQRTPRPQSAHLLLHAAPDHTVKFGFPCSVLVPVLGSTGLGNVFVVLAVAVG